MYSVHWAPRSLLRRVLRFAVAFAVWSHVPSGRAAPALRSIGSLPDTLERNTSEVVTLRGVITLVRKNLLYLQDPTGALAVVHNTGAPLSIGDQAEVQGEYKRHDFGGELHASAIRKLWPGSPPVPLSVNAEQAAEGGFQGHLIDTEGRLLKKRVVGGYLRLTLDGAGQIFGASLELPPSAGADAAIGRDLEENSLLRLVGVCGPTARAGEWTGPAFVVLLRSVADIRVESPPPWWNLEHSLLLAAAFALLLSGIHRIRHRARDARFQAVVEERARIARDMHDTLAQGFSGLTYQLEGLAHELKTSLEKESIEQHLTLALQLVRHCREEAHRSIFALRSLAESAPDVLDLLVRSCSSLRARSDVRIVTAREGRPHPLPDEILNQLLRIGQEAITNALQHANASEIRVVLRFAPTSVTLEIHDNGTGFDVDHARSIEAGRFGIAGMKERSKHIGAELSIRSTTEGTVVFVRAPLRRAPRRWWSRNGSEPTGAPATGPASQRIGEPS